MRGSREESVRLRATMTREEATEALALLAAEFGIAKPSLSWSERTRNGRAHPQENRIAIGPLAWTGTLHALLHEFAHILAYRRYACSGHDERFMRALLDTVTAWFGADGVSKYAWFTEYKRVAAFGKREVKAHKGNRHAS